VKKYNLTRALSFLLYNSLAGQILFACPESGRNDFTLTKNQEKHFLKASLDFAKVIAENNAKNSLRKKNDVHVDAPKGPFKKGSSSLLMTAKESDLTFKVTYNASITSANGWDCLYCVTYRGDGQYFSFEKIEVDHCAK
jgi:hypothetical protein